MGYLKNSNMHNNYLHKSLLLFFFLILSGCTGVQSNFFYLKSSELFKDKKYVHAYFFAKQAVDGMPDNVKYHTMLAWTLLKQGRPERAAKVMAPFEKMAGDNFSVMQINAWICYALNKNEAAIEWFKKELSWANSQSDPDFPFCQSMRSDALYGMGLIHSRMNQLEKARDLFQQAIGLKNQFIGHRPIALAHAMTYFITQNYHRAKQEYEKIERDGPDAIVDTQIAWCLYYQKKYIEAELYLLKRLHEARDKRPFLYGLIFSTYAQKKFKQSKKYLKSLINVDPWFADTNEIWKLISLSGEWVDIPLEFASNYGVRGNFQRASQLCQDILSKEPDHCEAQKIDIWCELYQSHAVLALSQFNQYVEKEDCDPVMGKLGQGISLMYLGYNNDATHMLKQISKDSNYYFRAQMALGAISYFKGDLDAAIQTYQSNINMLFDTKDHFWPFLNLNTLGWSYIYKNEFKQAETIFSQMNEMRNHLSGLHLFGLSWAKFNQGDTEGAIASLLEYDFIPYDHFKQSMLVANAFYLQSDYEEAITIYEDNMRHLPEKELFFSWGSFALQNLGWCYIHTHQYQKAFKTFLKLKTYHPAPTNYVIYENLGWGYYYQGMMQQAERTFKHSLKVLPSSRLARDGLKQIKQYRSRRTK